MSGGVVFFEEFEKAGDEEFVSRRRTITEADAVLFTSLTGIVDPVFTDEIFAREQLFGGRVVPGPMIMSYAMGLTDELGYGSVVAALGINNVRFMSPVRPQDTIQVHSTVASTRPSESRPELGIVTLQHQVVLQDERVAQSFERTLLVRRIPV
ncbi:MAG TPA: MaoC family dehydratase [Pseudonocardiaceae bacterium]|nr:MaoC family dehydratase [Pseudonocardiaceae bacterium]